MAGQFILIEASMEQGLIIARSVQELNQGRSEVGFAPEKDHPKADRDPIS